MTADIALLPGLNVSRETQAHLLSYADLVLKWTTRINLVSAQSATDIWNRHIIDSAQLYQYAPSDWTTWADLGSGAGFPGLVIAIIELDHVPIRNVTLVESDRRKSTFLNTVRRELGLRATIRTDRIESLAPLSADVVSARALGSLSVTLTHCNRHMQQSGVALLPKGRSADEEIIEAKKHWHFDVIPYQSVTDEEAQILRIERISRA